MSARVTGDETLLATSAALVQLVQVALILLCWSGVNPQSGPYVALRNCKYGYSGLAVLERIHSYSVPEFEKAVAVVVLLY